MTDLTDTNLASAHVAQGQFVSDPQRPIYHFLPPANWLNDPNGLIQWKDQYHLFYQYNPNGPFHGTIHWGHAVSHDLVHWRDLPIALAPSPGGPDSAGCWSGCAVDDNGVPTLIYSGHAEDNPGGYQLPCLATGDDELITWTKYEGNPLLAAPPPELDIVEFRDHCVWKEGDYWYQLIGAGIRDVGGTSFLFRSHDLRAWEYVHPLAVGDKQRTEPVWTGSMWECPDFFHLGDRHALVVSIWHEHKLYYPIYMIGDYTDQRLKIRNEGFVDLGRTFYAPQSMTDEQGRRIMWGWLRESRSIAAQMKAGWSGVLSLPRQLSVLSKGELGMQPAPELQALRRSHRRWCELVCHGDDAIMLDGAAGAAIEIIVEWEPGDATEVGLKVRAAPDGTEETLILFDRAAQRLRIDRTRSSLAEDTSSADVGGPFRLDADESLRLHVFLDASVIEVFANGRACLSTRIYPTRPESIALGVFARGGRATLRSLDTWRMASIWPEGERCRIPDA